MNVKRRALSPLIIFSLISLALLTTWGLDNLNFFSRTELASFDHRVSIFRTDKKIHDDVVLVMIDEDSLQNMSVEFGRWPWPRSAYKDLLEFFSLAKANAFAFDILFVEQESSGQSNDSDQQLIEASKKSGIAVHAMNLLDKFDSDSVKSLPADFIKLHKIDDIEFDGISHNDYLIPLDDLYRASRDVGFLEIEPDRDGVYRRIRLFNQFKNEDVFPALSTALVLPLISDGSRLKNNNDFALLGDTEVPLDGKGQYLMNPYGQLNTLPAFKVFEAMKQIRAGQTENLIVNPADYKNKIILLGASAIGLLDAKNTSIATKQAGVNMHAYTVSNILEQDFLIKISTVTNNILIAVFSVITILSVLLIPSLFVGTVIPVALATLYLFVAYASFANNYLFSIMPILFSIFFSLLLAFLFRSYTEKHGKKRVRAMLSQYVSPSVLTNVMDNYDTLNAEVGSNEILSILFSDIRGFTNISESQPAHEVVDMLNIYFSQMTDIIFEHEGTLDKFIGDAIMAFWGAPIKSSNHADQAVKAAIMMRKKLIEVNNTLTGKGYNQIEIGIGVHTGKVVLGNIGSSKKLDYTIIGDSVNMASRIEGITKQYGVSLIISEDTVKSLTSKIPCLVVDEVRLKGKQRTIKLFTPASTFKEENNIKMSITELTALSDKAFKYYQQLQWDKALSIYQQFPECRLFRKMTDRCISFINDEPDQGWDGVYTHTTK